MICILVEFLGAYSAEQSPAVSPGIPARCPAGGGLRPVGAAVSRCQSGCTKLKGERLGESRFHSNDGKWCGKLEQFVSLAMKPKVG